MAKWYKKISKEELGSFLGNYGKCISITQQGTEKPRNLEAVQVSKFYFEGDVFEVVIFLSYSPGDGYMKPGGYRVSENIKSINIL